VYYRHLRQEDTGEDSRDAGMGLVHIARMGTPAVF
jgi:hypothetical protein